MKNVSTAGIAAAIFASFTWSMNFVAPFVIGDYSIFDLAACRFLLSGLIRGHNPHCQRKSLSWTRRYRIGLLQVDLGSSDMWAISSPSWLPPYTQAP